MSSIRADVPHRLGQQEAVRRLEAFFVQFSERYKDQISHWEGTWDDNVLNFALTTYGLRVDGTIRVDEDTVHLEGKLPLAALAFKGKIEKTIESELLRQLS
jgi:hypothetical protein